MGIKNKLLLLTVAILVVAVAVASFYFFVLKPSLKPEIHISVPQGWIKVQALSLTNDASGVQYQGDGTIEEAIAVFRTELMRVGWSHVRDETPQEGFSFSVLKKEIYEATIMAVEVEPNKIIVTIVAAISKQEIPKKLELPKEDVKGEDFIDVPRFPGSVRINYENCSESVSVKYLASANITAVTEYYVIELPAKGWALEGMTVGGNKTEIYATKMKLGYVVVEIESSNNGFTYIDILFILYH